MKQRCDTTSRAFERNPGPLDDLSVFFDRGEQQRNSHQDYENGYQANEQHITLTLLLINHSVLNDVDWFVAPEKQQADSETNQINEQFQNLDHRVLLTEPELKSTLMLPQKKP